MCPWSTLLITLILAESQNVVSQDIFKSPGKLIDTLYPPASEADWDGGVEYCLPLSPSECFSSPFKSGLGLQSSGAVLNFTASPAASPRESLAPDHLGFIMPRIVCQGHQSYIRRSSLFPDIHHGGEEIVPTYELFWVTPCNSTPQKIFKLFLSLLMFSTFEGVECILKLPFCNVRHCLLLLT